MIWGSILLSLMKGIGMYTRFNISTVKDKDYNRLRLLLVTLPTHILVQIMKCVL